MKGMIFRSFLEYAEKKFGYQLVDKCLVETRLKSGGVYSSLGYYEFDELSTILGYICDKTGSKSEELLQDYGRNLFSTLYDTHPQIVADYSNSIELLTFIEAHIHFEVTKLYPDASPPDIKVNFENDQDIIELTYRSHRPLAFLFLGLVEGCLEHMGEEKLFQISKHPSEDYKSMSLKLALNV